MNQVPVIHVTIKDNPPPTHTEMVGRWIPCGPAFQTFVPDYARNAEVNEDEDEMAEATETKVVRKPRRGRPKANEVAETK